MARLVLHEFERWIRTIGAPLAVFALITFVPSLLPAAGNDVAQSAQDELLSVAWIAACAASLAWLAANSVRAALQPARDRGAAEHLQSLRDRAAGPDTRLVCVEHPLWQSPAGQRLVASDVRVGTVLEVWPDSHSPSAPA